MLADFLFLSTVNKDKLSIFGPRTIQCQSAKKMSFVMSSLMSAICFKDDSDLVVSISVHLILAFSWQDEQQQWGCRFDWFSWVPQTFAHRLPLNQCWVSASKEDKSVVDVGFSTGMCVSEFKWFLVSLFSVGEWQTFGKNELGGNSNFFLTPNSFSEEKVVAGGWPC